MRRVLFSSGIPRGCVAWHTIYVEELRKWRVTQDAPGRMREGHKNRGDDRNKIKDKIK